MKRFNPKKPIMATQWFKYGDHPKVEEFKTFFQTTCRHCGKDMSDHGILLAYNDDQLVCPGDYVGVYGNGEWFRMSPTRFENLYEAADD